MFGIKILRGIIQVLGGWSLIKRNLRWFSHPTDGSRNISRKQLEYILQLLENKYVNNLEIPNPDLLLIGSKNANERYGENCFCTHGGKKKQKNTTLCNGDSF